MAGGIFHSCFFPSSILLWSHALSHIFRLSNHNPSSHTPSHPSAMLQTLESARLGPSLPSFFFLSFSLSRKWEKTRKEEIISQTHQWKKSKELLNWTPSMTMKLPTPLTSATMTTADKRSCTQSIKGGSNLYYFTYSNKTISDGTYPFWVYPSTKTRLSTLWLMKLWDYLRDMKARNKATRLMTGRVGVGVWCGRGMSTSAMK